MRVAARVRVLHLERFRQHRDYLRPIVTHRVPVADIRSAHADLSARGVQFVSAPHMIHRHDDGTEEWMAFFEDNECRPLAIMDWAIRLR